MRYMLDTNILVYVLNASPRHEAVLERFEAVAGEQTGSAAALGPVAAFGL